MNDTTGEGGDELVEIMAGTFIICGFNPDSGEDTSLHPATSRALDTPIP